MTNGAISSVTTARTTIPGTSTNFRPSRSARYPITGLTNMPTSTSNPINDPRTNRFSKLLCSGLAANPSSSARKRGKTLMNPKYAMPRSPATSVIPHIRGFRNRIFVSPICVRMVVATCASAAA